MANKPKTVCHIHDKVHHAFVDKIRENVCVNDHPLTLLDGKHYCLFHLPTHDKDVENFEAVFRRRLDAVENRGAEIASLPEDEQAEATSMIGYDFRYVWFPAPVYLGEYEFSAAVYFSSATFWAAAYFTDATFSAFADFSSATFSHSANFLSATFLAETDFTAATFSALAYFNSVTFSADAYFRSATFSTFADFTEAAFSADAHFKSARFSANASFNAAIFSAAASFTWATFSARADFNSTTFSAVAKFSSATFAAYASFSWATFLAETFFGSAVFGNESDVFFRGTSFSKRIEFSYCKSEGYFRFGDVTVGPEASFDFQEAAFQKASLIAFHTITMCPGWFVNVDSRKFVFTDITWKNLDWSWSNGNIKSELNALEERGIKDQKKRIFEVAARQLAVNAEENNRYDEAAKFRYMAMETRRLETKGSYSPSRFLTWLYKWTSGYGESWSWAELVLIAVLVFFGLVYDSPFATFIESEKKPGIVGVAGTPDQTKSMNNSDGMVYSLYVAALQRPEPKPADNLTRFFVILETILAPLQAALLALAIRRKFMR